MHGYIFRKVEADIEIDMQASRNWLNTGLSSHVEGYATALQEQEIPTKATIKRHTKELNIESKCRLCKDQEETVFHVLGSCSSLSSNLYLTTRHDNIARELAREIANVEKPKKQRGPFPAVSHTSTQEIWWNHLETTVNKIKYNRPDIIIWDKEKKQCSVIDICAPLDFNVNNRQVMKIDKYMLLVNELQQLQPGYSYQIVPIVVGALGTISTKLPSYLKKLHIKYENLEKVTRKLQKVAVLGSVKIMKTFMKLDFRTLTFVLINVLVMDIWILKCL